ncbi:hypothetical protein HDE_12638 [Halotydeus destructor]|nr:hypothetical protein HDE_12638 [Halotydeus destructor]
MESIRKLAVENLEKVQMATASRHNETHRAVEYSVGDKVLLKHPNSELGKAKKLLHSWRGPYEITKKITPLAYEVKLVNGKGKKIESVNITRMKPYYERSRSTSSESSGNSSSELEFSSGECQKRKRVLNSELAPIIVDEVTKAAEPANETVPDATYVRASGSNDFQEELMPTDDSKSSDDETLVNSSSSSAQSESNSSTIIEDGETAIQPQSSTPEQSPASPAVERLIGGTPRRSHRERKKTKLFQVFVLSLFCLVTVQANFVKFRQLSGAPLKRNL